MYKKTTLLIATILLLTFLNCKAQLIPQQDEDTQLLVGTWVTEGSAINNRWKFNSDGTMENYTDNEVEATYAWLIINSINSGVKSKYLKLTNVLDSNNVRNYEISILDEVRMTLIYQRGNNMGIGKPFTMFKQ